MNELEIKTERLTQMLAESGLDAIILNAQHNFAWITCGASNGVDLSRENGVASVMVTRDGKRYVLASVIEIERMLDEEVSEDDFEPIDFSWQGEKADPASVLDKVRAVVSTGAAIASDIAMFPGTPAIESQIAPCRYSLTATERDRFRRLGRDANGAMTRCIGSISPGETEAAIAEKLRHELANDGIVSVVTLVAADERIARYRHPVPTQKLFESTLLLVTCAKRSGLIASLSRMVSVGKPDASLKARTEAAEAVFASLADATRPGTTGSMLYRTAADAYAAAGFADEINRHHQGGAAGYRTRDWLAHPASRETVQMHQAFAWNPTIAGTKVEETFMVTEDGIVTITASDERSGIIQL